MKDNLTDSELRRIGKYLDAGFRYSGWHISKIIYEADERESHKRMLESQAEAYNNYVKEKEDE